MAYEIVPCLYDSHKDLSSRLDSTICRYDNVPYFVRIADYNQIWLYDIIHPNSQQPLLKINPKDRLFDISSPELGYLNADPKKAIKQSYPLLDKETSGSLVVRIVRLPVRQWKQGINPDCVTFSNISGSSDIKGMYLSYQSVIYSQGMKDLILGSYPTPSDALDILMSNSRSDFRTVAISREVAFELTESGIIQVYIRTKNIGYILPGNEKVNIKPGPHSWVVQRILSSLGLSCQVD